MKLFSRLVDLSAGKSPVFSRQYHRLSVTGLLFCLSALATAATALFMPPFIKGFLVAVALLLLAGWAIVFVAWRKQANKEL